MKYFACAYYPEYWGIERAKTDAQLMRDAGINVVRIGEFAWSHLEQREGEYRTEWLSQTLEVLGTYDIQAILCTPTASAPPWLVAKYPEILSVNKDGRPAWVGVRQHACYTSPVYRHYASVIIEKLCSVADAHSNVLGWQIDNEIGHTVFGLCHCEVCQSAFQLWLADRYGTIDSLNQAWGNGFWGMLYSEWRQIRLGDMGKVQSSSHVLDSLRFHSSERNGYLRLQVEQIRSRFPTTLITTNSMSGISDRYEAYVDLDRAGVDIYPTSETFSNTAYLADLFRPFKKETPLWVLETGIGGQGYVGAPHNERLRAQYWQFIARGAEMISIFRWRTCLSGYEKDLMGIIGHSGVPRERYKKLKECISEVNSVAPLLQSLPMPRAVAGLVFDPENHWAACSGHWSEWERYEECSRWAHKQLSDTGMVVDVISTKCDLASYRILVMHAMLHVSEEFASKLCDYVEGGGILIMMGMAGMFTGNATYLPYPGPDRLQSLLGLTIEDQLVIVSFDGDVSADGGKVSFSGKLDHENVRGTADHWLADIELTDGKVLMSFENSALKGQPAVVEKASGAGVSLYIGAAKIDDLTMSRLLDHACAQVGLLKPARLPKGVERVERGRATFFINHTSQPVSVPCDFPAAARIGSFSDGVVRLDAYDVCLLEAV